MTKTRRNLFGLNIWNVITTLAVLIWFSASAMAAKFIPVENPDAFSRDILAKMSNKNSAEAANMIASQMGKPEAAETLTNGLKVFEGKTFDFNSKLVDKEYNNALRQIVYYSFIKELGFVYFRFNFKKSSEGWILANFTFKDETNELFPKDFAIP